MKFFRPKGLLAGFAATDKTSGGALIEVGEKWTPGAWKINWHRNNGWELYYQAKGRSAWRLGRARFEVPEGGFYLIAPDARHSLDKFHTPEAHFYYAVFHPEKVLAKHERPLIADWRAPFHTGAGAGSLEAPFRALIREVSMQDAAHETGVRAQLTALCVECHRLLHAAATPGKPALAAHPAAMRARECMESNPGHAWRLDELAALAGVSAPHLGEVFGREYGEPPGRYLRRRRLEIARDLLRDSNRPVTRIAQDLGFASSQHFANAYKRHFKLTPRAQRKGI